MIELRNRQYMTIIDCTAGADLVQGNVITLEDHGDTLLRAVKAVDTGDVNAITGPLLAHWINDRSTAVAYTLDTDGYSLSVTGSTDDDSIHYIPSGSNMLAIGGKGVAEVRVYRESLDSEFASTLPAIGDTLKFSSDESLLCSSSNGSAVNKEIGFVVEADSVSVAVLLG